jgi:hypothetical protein
MPRTSDRCDLFVLSRVPAKVPIQPDFKECSQSQVLEHLLGLFAFCRRLDFYLSDVFARPFDPADRTVSHVPIFPGAQSLHAFKSLPIVVEIQQGFEQWANRQIGLHQSSYGDIWVFKCKFEHESLKQHGASRHVSTFMDFSL